jgi:hypothetical protein
MRPTRGWQLLSGEDGTPVSLHTNLYLCHRRRDVYRLQLSSFWVSQGNGSLSNTTTNEVPRFYKKLCIMYSM